MQRIGLSFPAAKLEETLRRALLKAGAAPDGEQIKGGERERTLKGSEREPFALEQVALADLDEAACGAQIARLFC